MNYFRYLLGKFSRHKAVNFFIFAEIFVSLFLGAIGIDWLIGAQGKEEVYSPELYDVSMSSYHGDAVPEDFYGELSGRHGFVYTAYGKRDGGSDSELFVALGRTAAEYSWLDISEGRWFDTSAERGNEILQAVADDVYCRVNGCALGDVLTFEVLKNDGSYDFLSVEIVGVNAYSSSNMSVYTAPQGLVNTDRNSIFGYLYVMTDDGDARYCLTEETMREHGVFSSNSWGAVSYRIQAGDRTVFSGDGFTFIDSLGELYEDQARSARDRSNAMLVLSVAIILLSVSTILASHVIMLNAQKRENAAAYVCGLDRRRAVATETVKNALLFAVPFLISLAVVGAGSGRGGSLQIEGMTGFWITAGILFSVYAATCAVSQIILAKTRPTDGFKEDTV